MCVLRFDARHIRVCIVTFQANVFIVTTARISCMTTSNRLVPLLLIFLVFQVTVCDVLSGDAVYIDGILLLH